MMRRVLLLIITTLISLTWLKAAHAARTYWLTNPGSPASVSWNGINPINVSGSAGCAISVRNGNNGDLNFGLASGNNFSLNLVNVPFVLTNSGSGETLPVQIFYNSEQLFDNDWTGANRFAGGGDITPSPICSSTGAFSLAASVADLSSVTAGTYSRLGLPFCAVRGGNARRLDRCPKIISSVPSTLPSAPFGETIFIDFSITVPPLVTVQQLGDIDLGTYSLNTDASNSDDFCIGSNSAGGVSLVINSAASTAGFFLTGQNNGDEIPYTVEFTDSGGVTTVLSEGGSGITLAAAQIDSLSCSGAAGGNVNLRVTALASNINQAGDTDYQDTLTVLVSPET